MDINELVQNIFNLNHFDRGKLLNSIGPNASQFPALTSIIPNLSDEVSRSQFYTELDNINSFEAQQLKFHIAINFEDFEIVASIWNSTDISIIKYSIQNSGKLFKNESWWPKLDSVLNEASYVAQQKILKKITSINTPRLCELGFDWVLKHYGLESAVDLLPHCSEDFIQNYLNQQYHVIPHKIIDKLIRTGRGHLVFPFIEKSLKSENRLNSHETQYVILIIKFYPEKMIDFLSNYYKKTYQVTGEWNRVVRVNPQTVYDIILKNVNEYGLPEFVKNKEILRVYSEHQVTELMIKYLDKRPYLNRYKPTLPLVSRPNRFPICMFVYGKLESSDQLGFLVDLVKSSYHFDMLDYNSRAKILDMVLGLDEEKLNRELGGSFTDVELKSTFKQLSLLSISKNFDELVKLLKRYGSNVDDRNEGLRILFHDICNTSDNTELLTKFLDIIYDRYRNDQPKVHSGWLYELQSNFYRLLNWDHLQILYKLIENWKLKPTQNSSSIQIVLGLFWKILIINVERNVSNTIQCQNTLNLNQCTDLLVNFVNGNNRNENTQDYFADIFTYVSAYSRSGEFKSTFPIDMIERSVNQLYPNLLSSGNHEYMKQAVSGWEYLFNKSHLVRVPQILSILEIFTNSDLEYEYIEIPLTYHSLKPVSKQFLFEIIPSVPEYGHYWLQNILYETPQSIDNYLTETYQVQNSNYIQLNSQIPNLSYECISKIKTYGLSMYNRKSLTEKETLIELIQSLLLSDQHSEWEKQRLVKWLSKLPQWWTNNENISKYLPPITDSKDGAEDSTKDNQDSQSDRFVLIDEDDPTNVESNEIDSESYSNQLKSKFLTSLSGMPDSSKALDIVFPYFRSDFSSLVSQTVSAHLKRFNYTRCYSTIQDILTKGVKISVQKELVRLVFANSYVYDKDSKLQDLWTLCRKHTSLSKTLLEYIPGIAPHLNSGELLLEICSTLIQDTAYYDTIVDLLAEHMMKSDYREQFIRLVFDNLPEKNRDNYLDQIRFFMIDWIKFTNDDYFTSYLKEIIFVKQYLRYLGTYSRYFVKVCYDFNSQWDNMNRMDFIIRQYQVLIENCETDKKSKLINEFLDLCASLSDEFDLKDKNWINQQALLEDNFNLMIQSLATLMNHGLLNYKQYTKYFKICLKLIFIKNYHTHEQNTNDYYTTVGAQLLQLLLGETYNNLSYRPSHLTFFEDEIITTILNSFQGTDYIKHDDAFFGGLEDGFKSTLIIPTLIKLFLKIWNNRNLHNRDVKIDKKPNIQRIVDYLSNHEEYQLYFKCSLGKKSDLDDYCGLFD